ncbi:MAG: hypothetical protein CVT49_09460 [candidate division Zixibacteria bacterium HGW-Zixibacteria-1]|nr:MAG: hypothetical protein CVT49_09460 [candidate division Zixibacteria bacterium HGW-Zixibacteria-1]
MTTFKSLILIFLIIAVAYPALFSDCAAAVSKDAVPPKLALPLFLKIITYDQCFNRDSISKIVVYIVSDKSVSESFEQAAELQDFIHSTGPLKVHDIPVRPVFVSIPELKDSLKNDSKDQYRITVLTNLKRQETREVVEACRSNHVSTFALDPALLVDGVSVSVISDRDGAHILIDISSSRMEQTQYSAHLLKICKVYKNGDLHSE